MYQDTKKEAVYQTLIRLGEGKEPIEFEVKMLEVPIGDKEGKEVIAKWHFDGIDSEDVFYTDSNGLEMQERKRDARPDWTMTSNMTVSNNYYPVSSAIAIRGKTSGAQVTVMNERAQGGTSLASGTIELMQHRRLLCMDSLNINEALNETQADGRGIAVNTRYFVSFSNANITSVQRHTQLLIDEPILVWYSTDFKVKSGPTPDVSDLNLTHRLTNFRPL